MKTRIRNYSPLDQFLLQAEQGLRSWAQVPSPEDRPNPAATLPEAPLQEADRRHLAGLMRVNHAGEVCAQALYFGQALLARTPDLQAHLHQAALEEGDHLRWCADRLHELDDRPSLLNPLWYSGSVLIGMIAACLGDKISLGFIAATEAQVEAHLQGHLDQLPAEDLRSRAILVQMQADERAHGSEALAAGGEPLPEGVQKVMHGVSRILCKLAYLI
jgi:ubiquinone biosynthesis monooxygenase Coq7